MSIFILILIIWLIYRLQLHKPVGQGNFGTVYKGELCGVGKNKEPLMTVAVKMLKDPSNDSDMADLVSEMEVMKRIGKHLNIINLIGCCTKNGEYKLFRMIEMKIVCWKKIKSVNINVCILGWMMIMMMMMRKVRLE